MMRGTFCRKLVCPGRHVTHISIAHIQNFQIVRSRTVLRPDSGPAADPGDLKSEGFGCHDIGLALCTCYVLSKRVPKLPTEEK